MPSAPATAPRTHCPWRTLRALDRSPSTTALVPATLPASPVCSPVRPTPATASCHDGDRRTDTRELGSRLYMSCQLPNRPCAFIAGREAAERDQPPRLGSRVGQGVTAAADRGRRAAAQRSPRSRARRVEARWRRRSPARHGRVPGGSPACPRPRPPPAGVKLLQGRRRVTRQGGTQPDGAGGDERLLGLSLCARDEGGDDAEGVELGEAAPRAVLWRTIWGWLTRHTCRARTEIASCSSLVSVRVFREPASRA